VEVFHELRHVTAIWATILIVIYSLHFIALPRGTPNTAWIGVLIPRHDSGAIYHPGMKDVEQDDH
jgi:hypothetical protein